MDERHIVSAGIENSCTGTFHYPRITPPDRCSNISTFSRTSQEGSTRLLGPLWKPPSSAGPLNHPPPRWVTDPEPAAINQYDAVPSALHTFLTGSCLFFYFCAHKSKKKHCSADRQTSRRCRQTDTQTLDRHWTMYCRQTDRRWTL